MSQSTIWWLLAGAAVGVELVTGTFYLLMVAIGLAAAALAALVGVSSVGQVVIAAVVGAGSVLVWHRYKRAQPAVAPAHANPDVNLDIGQPVQVEVWSTNRSATVKYRGAIWTAVLQNTKADLVTGTHRIVAVVGNQLIVEPS